MLNASGIAWLVLRNYECLPEVNRSKDVDLGIEKKHRDRVTSIITAELKARGFDRILIQNFQYVRCCTYFKVCDSGTVSIKIDLLDGFVWRGAQVFDFSDLYATRVAWRNVFVPRRVDDGVMLWLKPLLTGGFVKRGYVGDICRASAQNPGEFRETLIRTLGVSMGNRAWAYIKQGQLSDTIPLKAQVARAVWLQAFRRAPFKTLWNCVMHFLTEFVRRSRRVPGSFLAVVGPDGVGKTTFITLLQAEVAKVLVKDLAGC